MDEFDFWDDLWDEDPVKEGSSPSASVQDSPPEASENLSFASPSIEDYGDALELEDDYKVEVDQRLVEQERKKAAQQALAANDPQAIAAYRKKRREHRQEAEVEVQDSFESDLADVSMVSQITDADQGYADEIKKPSAYAVPGTGLHSGRRKARRKEVLDRKVYNLDAAAVKDMENGYDGYYEDVRPDDYGKAAGSEINWAMVGVVFGSMCLILGVLYYIVYMLGF